MVIACAQGSKTPTPCTNSATVEVRKPRSRALGQVGPDMFAWLPLCAQHDDHAEHGQQVRPVLDLAALQLHVLAVLPTHPPGLRQARVRERLGHRLTELGLRIPGRDEVNQAIQLLITKRLLHSHLIRPPGEEYPYNVYWRDASYIPPLEARTHG